MSYKDLDYLIYDYPLSLLHTSEDVEEGVKEKKYFYYETPIINSDSRLYNMKAIKYYLKEYLSKTERLMDEYIKANHPVVMPNDIFNHTFDVTNLMYICGIYIQRVCEGIEEKPKKVLSFQDGDGPNPTYFLEGIRPKFFRLPFKIQAKVYLIVIE